MSRQNGRSDGAERPSRYFGTAVLNAKGISYLCWKDGSQATPTRSAVHYPPDVIRKKSLPDLLAEGFGVFGFFENARYVLRCALG